MTEQPEKRIYALDYHNDWADLDDLRPPHIEIPDELRPSFITRDPVEDVDDLRIYTFDIEEPPHFPEEDGAVEASPEELARWRGTYEQYLEAAQQYRKQAEVAMLGYVAIMKRAEAELAAAMAEYRPVEEELKERSLALALSLHEHREAGRAFLARKKEAEEAALDAQYGPRTLLLYPPKDLDSPRQGDWLARVHLVGCKRRRGMMDDPVRAQVAVVRLSDPAKWPKSEYGATHRGRHQMRVKMCSFCKPWRVLFEHAGIDAEFFRKNIKLDEWPDGLTDDLRKLEEN